MTCLNTIDQLITERYSPLKNLSGVKEINMTKRHALHLVFNKIDLEPESEKKLGIILNELDDILSIKEISSINQISCKTKYGIEKMIGDITTFKPI